MPDLTAHTAEIVAYVVGGLAMTFLVFRFATFLESVVALMAGIIGDFLRR